MKIYLAHPDTAPGTRVRVESDAVRATLAAAGHLVMPRGTEPDCVHLNPWEGENSGLRQVADIDACDLLVAWTFGIGTTSRVDTLVGYALGLGKNVIQLGPITNVIQCLPTVTHYLDVSEVLDALEKLG